MTTPIFDVQNLFLQQYISASHSKYRFLYGFTVHPILHDTSSVCAAILW